MAVPIVIASIVALLAIKAIVSAEEAAASHITRGRVLRLVESERKGATSLERLFDRPGRLQAAASMASALAYTVAAALSAIAVLFAYEAWPDWLAAITGAAIGLVVFFALGEALPRTLAAQNPEGVALAFAPLAAPLVPVFYPLARVLNAPWRWIMRLAVGESAAHSAWAGGAEIRVNGISDEEEAAREESEEALLEAVSEFAEKVVREIMVPRTDMACLPDTASAADAIALIESLGYSRLPVYHGTVDDIRGVLYAKDLLAAIVRDPGVRPASIARPAYFVPETKLVEELLMEMRTRTHIAIVADEYGGTAGLVTIEDLLEEIVGEIFDEYDSAVPLIFEAEDGSLVVDARLPVDDLNERFDTAMELEADTVGGLFTEVAGHIPEVGESVEIEGLRLTVEELQGTRIMKLTVRPAATAADRKEGPDA
ncbi:MAG: HlyC/CorC family transporter [Coriobacteriia bacterium]|nr:HlyC/CorC family transporter [Coriobacteriia bacterium]